MVSDSDSDAEFRTPTKPLRRVLDVCLEMKPTYTSDTTPTGNGLNLLRDVLTKKLDDINKRIPQKRPPRTASQKAKADENDVPEDLLSFSKKIDLVFEVLFKICDKFYLVDSEVSETNEKVNEVCSKIRELEPTRSAIETRISNLESKISTYEVLPSDEQPEPTFASTVRGVSSLAAPRRTSPQVTTDRIERLEFQSSEEERKRRLLQVTITHPNIDNKNPDSSAVLGILRDQLKMDRREIDSNMRIAKFSRANTALLLLSHKRFKIFLFKARKRLRDSNANELNNLYLNEHLTTYNHQILMSLKNSKKLRSGEGLHTFASVYTFEGKVYVKKDNGAYNDDAILVKTPSMAHNLDEQLAATSTEQEASTT